MTTSCATSKPASPDRLRAPFRRLPGLVALGLLAVLVPGVLRAQTDGHGHPHADVPEHPDSAAAPAAPVDSLAPLPPMPPPGPPTVYIDLDRNRSRLTSPAAVAALVDTIARSGFRRVIVDVKTRDGLVLYPSRVAPTLDAGFDYFGAFREATRKHDLELGALFSVFVEGDPKTKTGPAYERATWQTIYRTSDGVMVNQAQVPTLANVYVNPVLFEVQRYEAMSFSDLLSSLKPDFICIDEVRFFNSTSDLSDSTRYAFDAWYGLSPAEWPDAAVNQQHPRFAWWVAFRVGVIHEFVGRLKRLRDTVAPGTPLILMAPAYYEPATTIGVNWGHSSFTPPMWYANKEFRKRSLADVVDELVLVSRDANPLALSEIVTVVKHVTRHQRAASIFLPIDVFQKRGGRLIEGVDAVRNGGLGLVVGDAGQIGASGMWPLLEELLAKP